MKLGWVLFFRKLGCSKAIIRHRQTYNVPLCVNEYIHSFIHSFIHAFIHTFIHTFIHPCIPSSMYSFIHSFNSNVWLISIHEQILWYEGLTTVSRPKWASPVQSKGRSAWVGKRRAPGIQTNWVYGKNQIGEQMSCKCGTINCDIKYSMYNKYYRLQH